MFTLTYKPSTAHWLFPPIIMGILALLLIVIIIQRAVKCHKEKISFFPQGVHFFAEHWDKGRLLGTLGLFVLYIFAMQIIGFLFASMVVMFLYNTLYSGIGKPEPKASVSGNVSLIQQPVFRSVMTSLLSSVVSSLVIWFLFSRIFKITLP